MVLMVAALVVAQKLDLNRVSLFDLKQLIKILPVSVFYNANVAFALAGLAQLNVSNLTARVILATHKTYTLLIA